MGLKQYPKSMITYKLENKEDKSLYEYLYECIRDDIRSGVLKSGEKLPSKRAFASNQGISVVTVENTYAQLQAEGYIYSLPKSGFYVSDIGIDGDKNIVKGPLKTFPDAEETEHVNESVDQDEPTYNMVSNHTDPENFPFSNWAKIMRSVLTTEEKRLLKNPPTGGVYELREAIAVHLKAFRGIDVSPEQIIVGAGSEYLYNLIVQLLGRDKVYGIENPGSRKIRNIYSSLGVNVKSVGLDGEGVETDGENLNGVDILQISPSHQFPLGTVTGIGRRMALIRWANEREGRYIIEDDYDSEFRLQGKPIGALFSLDTTGRVIYFNTFTKSLSSTIRVSYMVLPKELLLEFKERLSFYSCTVSNFEQYTLAKFISEGHFEKHINRMRKHYRELRDVLISELMLGPLKDRIEFSEENAGLHFLIRLDAKDMSDEELKAMALKEGILVSFLSEYLSTEGLREDEVTALRDKYKGYALINYSGLNEGNIRDAACALSLAWGFVL